MKLSNWFYIGICCFSILFGILIGASQSPVVGIFITGFLGLIVTVVSILYNNKTKVNSTNANNFVSKILGISLILISVFLVYGLYLGSNYRVNFQKADNKKFIWNKNNKPESVYEALDWIVVTNALKNDGYTESQIKEIYSLRKENDSSWYNNYDERLPYFTFLIDNYKNADKDDWKDVPLHSMVRRP